MTRMVTRLSALYEWLSYAGQATRSSEKACLRERISRTVLRALIFTFGAFTSWTSVPESAKEARWREAASHREGGEAGGVSHVFGGMWPFCPISTMGLLSWDAITSSNEKPHGSVYA